MEAFLLIAIVLAPIVVIAHLAEKRANLRPVLHLVLLALNWLFVINFTLTLAVGRLSVADARLALILAIVFAVASTLMLLAPVRRRLARWFPVKKEGEDTGFDPDSMVHMTALVFCLSLLENTILGFAVAGGLPGLAENYTPETAPILIAQMVLFVLFATLGVGFGIKRNLSQTLQRLGLRAPTLAELGAAVGTAFLLFSTVMLIDTIWRAVTPPDVIKEQTKLSELIASGFNTLTIGFLVAATAAIGEEIAFRGALQPVFGLWVTTIFFALIHIQYILTPATLIIVAVGLGLGWLRRRYNTTVSIVAHFLYNFVSIALFVYGRYLQDMLGTGK